MIEREVLAYFGICPLDEKGSKLIIWGRVDESPTDFEEFADCRHSIRLKQHTPLLVGNKPSHPGMPPSAEEETKMDAWNKRADAYASYYLSLFMPREDLENKELNWSTLQEFVDKLQKPKHNKHISSHDDGPAHEGT